MTTMTSDFASESNDSAPPRSGSPDKPMLVASPEPFVKLNFVDPPNDLAKQAQSAVMLEAFVNAVERLERILDLETEMLKQNKPVTLHDFNHKKSYGLLELRRTMNAMRALDYCAFDGDAKAPLARLRVKLERNLAILQTHLKAVGEIAAIIARAIQDHESDGTYTADNHGEGDRR